MTETGRGASAATRHRAPAEERAAGRAAEGSAEEAAEGAAGRADGRGRWIAAALALAAVFALLVLPPIATGAGGTSEAKDQARFHLPTIRTLAEQLPAPDLVHLQSATAPGYHLVLATVARAGLDSERALRAVASLASLAMLLVAWGVAARRAGPWTGLLLVAPLVLSSYVLGAAIWLTTDNAALLFVLGAVALGLAPTGPRRLAAAGLLVGLAVWTRQIHAWAAIVPAAGLVAAWRRRPPGRAGGPDDVRPWDRWRAAERAAVAAAVVLPAAVVGLLVALWGGLVPPALADYHDRGIRWAQPVLTLALLGGFGAFFAPVLVAPGSGRDRGPLLVAALVAGLAALPPTSWAPDAGRWGGAIWELVRRTPAPGDRSLVLVAGAAVGAWVLVHAARRLRACGRGWDAALLGLSLAGWTAAHCLNAQTWQRYAEPLLLVGLAWAAATVLRASAAQDGDEATRVPPRWWLGPAVLTLGQAGLLGLTLVRPLLGG